MVLHPSPGDSGTLRCVYDLLQKQTPFPSAMRPVARTTQWRSEDWRRAVSALYFQFRVPPGLSATIGMSFLRSSSVNLLC